jgi:hypothetical protein
MSMTAQPLPRRYRRGGGGAAAVSIFWRKMQKYLNLTTN